LVLPFWYRLTWVVPEKGPLNGCVCVCTERCSLYDAVCTVVPVEQIHAAKSFKSAPAKGMSWSGRPAIIKQVYQRAEPPPALEKLNCFRFVKTHLRFLSHEKRFCSNIHLLLYFWLKQRLVNFVVTNYLVC